MSFRAFSRNEAVFATVCRKVYRNAKTWQFFRKVASFDQIHEFSCFFTKWTTFSNLFLKTSSKCENMVVCLKSCIVFAKSMISRAFSRNEALFATSFWKVHENAETWLFARKVASFGQIDGFSWFFRNWATFWNLLLKGSSKHQNMVVY